MQYLSSNSPSNSQGAPGPKIGCNQPLPTVSSIWLRRLVVRLPMPEETSVITSSGKLTIGDEFRTELSQAFTASQIEGGVDCTLAAMGTDRNKMKIAAQVRRQ